jgi:hypothetical protein
MRSSLIVSHLDEGAEIKKSVLFSGCRLACIITRTTVSYVIVERNTDYLITDGYVKIAYVSSHVLILRNSGRNCIYLLSELYSESIFNH